jgi:Meiotically up-regulated gene 113
MTSPVTIERLERAINVTARASDYLVRRGGMWRFVRRVPKEFTALDPRVIVQHSTKIKVADDPHGKYVAVVANDLNAALERHWHNLAEGKPSNYEAEKSAARSNQPKRPCFIYFIECGDYIKIGYATSVKSRLTSLATATPYQLKVLATIKGDKHTEAALHTRFGRCLSSWRMVSQNSRASSVH